MHRARTTLVMEGRRRGGLRIAVLPWSEVLCPDRPTPSQERADKLVHVVHGTAGVEVEEMVLALDEVELNGQAGGLASVRNVLGLPRGHFIIKPVVSCAYLPL